MTTTLPDQAANATVTEAPTVPHQAQQVSHPKLPPTPPSAVPDQLADKPSDKRVKALQRFAISITAFNIIGHLLLGFEQAPLTPIACVLFAYTLDLLLETLDARGTGRSPGFAGGWRPLLIYLLPAHITALACGMLLYGNASLWPYLFAVAVAICSKHFIKLRVNGRGKHFLNPSNFGIAVVLLIFPWVSISPPYHFTNNTTGSLDWLLPLGVLMAGTMLNAGLTGKLPLIMGWLGGFVGQAVVRWLALDHSLLGALGPMTGLAFILYTNYMITDPGTTPFKRRNQVVFGLATAAVYGLLVVSHVVFGLFFALVIICGLRGVVIVAAPVVRPAGQRAWRRLARSAAGSASGPVSKAENRPVGDAI